VIPVLNIAAYKFAHLDARAPLREELLAACRALGLKGTILLAPEGINLFLAGAEANIRAIQARLGEMPAFADLQYKESTSQFQPFAKMLVKLKREIVPLGENNVSPAQAPAPKVSARQLKTWLDEGREVVLLDVRNAFEVRHGTFRGACELALKNFRAFPRAARELSADLKDKTIVTFCTGGIRCEKAAPVLIAQGFRAVYQLDGGILKYFEECGDTHFEGECFVFDEREALDAELRAKRNTKMSG
jgi:UPF0176 protein